MIPFGGRLGVPALSTHEDKRSALAKFCSESKWCTPAPKVTGSSDVPHDPTSVAETSTEKDRPLRDLISPLIDGAEDFRGDETALEALIGAVDIKWFEGRERLAPTRDWGTFSSSAATDLRQCLISALMMSPEGEKVFSWFRDRRAGTPRGSPERDVIDHASTHAPGFVTTNVPPGFDDEDIKFILALGLLIAKERSLSPGHAELSSHTLRELWSGGVTEARRTTQCGGGRSHQSGRREPEGPDCQSPLKRTTLQRTSSSRPPAETRTKQTGRRGFGTGPAMALSQEWTGMRSVSAQVGGNITPAHAP